MLTEYVQYIETHIYAVDFELWATVPYEIKVYVIEDKNMKKYNLYILDYWATGTIPSDASVIVQLYSPETLEVAQQMFPNYKFTKKNYGF
jgi:hypothetical protein